MTARRVRARRQVRISAAAEAFSEDHSGVQDACRMVRQAAGVAVVTARCDGGVAWFMARAVPGNDILTSVGWCRRESGVSRLMDRARSQVDADHAARRLPRLSS